MSESEPNENACVPMEGQKAQTQSPASTEEEEEDEIFQELVVTNPDERVSV